MAKWHSDRAQINLFKLSVPSIRGKVSIEAPIDTLYGILCKVCLILKGSAFEISRVIRLVVLEVKAGLRLGAVDTTDDVIDDITPGIGVPTEAVVDVVLRSEFLVSSGTFLKPWLAIETFDIVLAVDFSDCGLPRPSVLP